MVESSKEENTLILEEMQSSSKKEFPNFHDDEEDLDDNKTKIIEKSPKERFYRFNEELGNGAYKTVYKGYDSESGCEIAWNVINLKKLPASERKRISKEILMLKNLKHPNIIHFIGTWINKTKEEVVFITEIVTGGSLKSYLKKIKKPRLKIIKTWCKEILKGLQYLHSQKPYPIIHRDIKCDNIFINSNKGEIRIGDLGLATFLSHSITTSVLGTPEFMAPEIFDESYGVPCDIYAFGMSVLEMVTLQTPYKECSNPAQIYKKLLEGKKPAALELIKNDDVKNFIMQCLKPQKERPSITQLLEDKFLEISDNESDNLPVQLVTDNINPDGSLRSISKGSKDTLMLTKRIKERKKDTEIGNEEEESKETRGEISPEIVKSPQSSPAYDQTKSQNVSPGDDSFKESKESEQKNLQKADDKNEKEKSHDFFSNSKPNKTSSGEIKPVQSNEKTSEVNKSGTNLELNYTPSFKTKADKIIMEIKLLGVSFENDYYIVLVCIITGKDSTTIEKKISLEDFTINKIYETLIELQHENLIEINEKSLMDLANEIFESPQKNLFIPDLKIESNEKNSKKQTNELISKKLNIVEEDLLEIERRHSFDVHLELGEKFKHFYQLYINSCIDKFLNENEDLMNKRFELELNILKDLHTNYKNERMQKEFSILNQTMESSDHPNTHNSEIGFNHKEELKNNECSPYLNIKSQDGSPHYKGFFTPPKHLINFINEPEKKLTLITEKVKIPKKNLKVHDWKKDKPPLNPSPIRTKEKDKKEIFALTLSLPIVNDKPLIHKKSQSNCDFNNHLDVDVPICFTSKSSDSKKKIITSSKSNAQFHKGSNESSEMSARIPIKNKEIIKNEPLSNKAKENNGNNIIIKKLSTFEQFSEYVFKGPLHPGIESDKHKEDIRLIKLGLQELLNIESIDSFSYDLNLENYVKNFQIKYNLNVDGIFGNKCWAVMKKEIEDKTKRKREEDKKGKTQDLEEKTKKFKDKQNKESAEAELKLISNIQKELNK